MITQVWSFSSQSLYSEAPLRLAQSYGRIGAQEIDVANHPWTTAHPLPISAGTWSPPTRACTTTDMTQPEPLHWMRQQRLRCGEKSHGVRQGRVQFK